MAIRCNTEFVTIFKFQPHCLVTFLLYQVDNTLVYQGTFNRDYHPSWTHTFIWLQTVPWLPFDLEVCCLTTASEVLDDTITIITLHEVRTEVIFGGNLWVYVQCSWTLEDEKETCGTHSVSTTAGVTSNQCRSNGIITITIPTGTTESASLLEVANPETAFTTPSVTITLTLA